MQRLDPLRMTRQLEKDVGEETGCRVYRSHVQRELEVSRVVDFCHTLLVFLALREIGPRDDIAGKISLAALFPCLSDGLFTSGIDRCKDIPGTADVPTSFFAVFQKPVNVGSGPQWPAANGTDSHKYIDGIAFGILLPSWVATELWAEEDSCSDLSDDLAEGWHQVDFVPFWNICQ